MKKIILGIIGIAVFLPVSLATAGTEIFGKITVLNGTQTTIPEASTLVPAYKDFKTLITLEGDSARFRYDTETEAVTATDGHKMVNGDTLILDNLSDIQAFRIIQTGAGTSTAFYSISKK